jgi:hypothetical protein
VKQLHSMAGYSALVLATLLAACGGDGPMMNDGGGGFAGGSGRPVVGATAAMRLYNRYTNVSIIGLYVSPTSRESWGPDLLSEDIGPGGSIVVEGIPCQDSYDLRVELTIGPALMMRGLEFSCGGETVLKIP